MDQLLCLPEPLTRAKGLVLLYNYLFPYLAPSVIIEGDSDYFFMARTISLAAQICFTGVVAGQSYLLQKKRRLLANHK